MSVQLNILGAMRKWTNGLNWKGFINILDFIVHDANGVNLVA